MDLEINGAPKNFIGYGFRVMMRHCQSLLSLARRRRLTACDAAHLERATREWLPRATLDGDLERAARVEGVAIVEAP